MLIDVYPVFALELTAALGTGGVDAAPEPLRPLAAALLEGDRAGATQRAAGASC